jgi:uncharacterized protein (TIGR02145 family)
MPDDPVGIVASVSQPADNFGSGESSVSFTVTFKDDVKQLVLNNSDPVAVKLLLAYTDNLSASKVAYLNIRVQDAGCYCPAQVPTSIHPLGSLIFMCKNLGATEEIRTIDDLAKITNTNFRTYHGNWYRFGVHTASLVSNGQYEGTDIVPDWTTANSESFPFATTVDWPQSPNGALGNPCPDGWRIPTSVEWGAVINKSHNGDGTFSDVTPVNNPLTRYQGTTVSSAWSVNNDKLPSGNYNNILQIGDYLFIPTAGGRHGYSGLLSSRGLSGMYWSSTGNSNSNAWSLLFDNGQQYMYSASYRSDGLFVRCVQKE